MGDSTRKVVRPVVVKGIIFSGLGEGEFYVNLYARSFRRALGVIPFPGTLNIRVIDEDVERLNNHLKKVDPVVILPPSISGLRLGKVYLFKASLFDIEVYIVRPEYTVYKGDVIEIISQEHLRRKYGLKDGDVVDIVI
ncbi:MAG: CTP-dependent riboflavin kinase [Desulfurococcales archaeon]|nr:CTP-dependent riboflavin kinase [Desulfurococcales archaeon]